ncbi:AMP-activated protein kinase, gamma [Nesidiocoris tenuis]|uniref:AMP-activated protein kinase, gamma n=1 Tax=Nesidiocoris tenuis TaxID=355587 RepID=A0ABN7B6A2_9HEMI|nr:AMP-activated protein kinase, gamma [Nesidiocoris tenuis]
MPPPIFLTPPPDERPVKKTRSIQDLFKSLGRAVRSRSPISLDRRLPSPNRRRCSSPAASPRRSSSPVPVVRVVVTNDSPRPRTGGLLAPVAASAGPLSLLEVPAFRGRSRSLDDGVRPAAISDCEATYRIYDQILSQGVQNLLLNFRLHVNFIST